jgi:predicted Rossmann fold nucleotide-binding protein DprA/Smf involved in DNA uptake
MNYYGNKDILLLHKIGFLCSRKVPAEIVLETYDWAIEQRDEGICVVSGFHSKIEKDVFHYLLKGTQPIIMVLARGMLKRLPVEIKTEIEKGRLLIVSTFEESVKRITRETTYLRNKYILKISDEIKIPFVSKNGLLEKLLQEKIRFHGLSYKQ